MHSYGWWDTAHVLYAACTCLKHGSHQTRTCAYPGRTPGPSTNGPTLYVDLSKIWDRYMKGSEQVSKQIQICGFQHTKHIPENFSAAHLERTHLHREREVSLPVMCLLSHAGSTNQNALISPSCICFLLFTPVCFFMYLDSDSRWWCRSSYHVLQPAFWIHPSLQPSHS